ncbi:odorant receptor 30a-like isoform X2 [Leptinotarsa decemlineata]|uniref:odorant receptor 30a-like isoform X2 n=1 Tax=Leptinotarsa decemlineata TaxID=7539 RepID=UPI003D30B52F
MFESNEEEAFSSTTETLKWFQVYPNDFQKSHMSFFLIVSLFLRLSQFILCCFLSFLHLVMNKKEGNDIDISQDITLVTAEFGLIVIGAKFVLRSNYWTLLMQKIIGLSKYGITMDLKQTIRRCNKISKFCTAYGVAAYFIYVLMAFYGIFDCLRINDEKGIHEICRVVLPTWLPFELTPRGEMVLFALQAISSFSIPVSAVVIPFLNWEAAQLLCERIRHLKELSQLILEEKQVDERRQKMKSWIGYHQEILGIIEDQNSEVKSCMGHMTLISALAIGCCINQSFSNYNPVGALCTLIGWIIILFFLCDAGQMITDNTESIAEAVYDMKWYEADILTRKDLLFILIRTQKPMELDALPLGTLNYALYLMILKTSYSYVTLLTNST